MSFRPTLRLVISALLALIVLVVAVTTLAITYTVSISTVRDIGRKHSLALATSAEVQTHSHFARPVLILEALDALFKAQDWYAPSADPANPSLAIHDKFFHFCYNNVFASEFTGVGIGVIFDDGAGFNCFLRPLGNDTLFYFESRSAWGWPAVRNMTGTRRGIAMGTRQEVPRAALDAAFGPLPANVDSRVATYPTSKAFVTPDRSGFWFPTLAFVTSGSVVPEFVLPAVKPLYNHSNGFIGLGIMSQGTIFVDAFLRSVLGTPHTQAFAVESSGGWLVGSTHPSPYYSFSPVVPGAPLRVGCSTTADTDFGLNPVNYVACRQRASGFDAYAPLKLASTIDGGAFLGTRGSRVELVEVAGEGNYFIVSTRVSSAFRLFGLNVVLCMPESDVLGDIVSGRNTAIGVTVAVFVVAAVTTFVAITFLLAPLGTIAERMQRAANLDDDDAEESVSAMAEVASLQEAYYAMNGELNRIRSFVPQSVLIAKKAHEHGMASDEDEGDLDTTRSTTTIRDDDTLTRSVRSNKSGALSGRRSATAGGGPLQGVVDIAGTSASSLATTKFVTVLVANARGFTAAAASVTPRTLPENLAALVAAVEDAVGTNGGVLGGFHGDHFTATFNAVRPCAAGPRRACAAALALTSTRLGADAAGYGGLRVKVGLAAGKCLVGNAGTATAKTFSVVGPAFPQAVLLERLSRLHGPECDALMTARVFNDVSTHFRYRVVDHVLLPPRQPTLVAALLGRINTAATPRAAAAAGVHVANQSPCHTSLSPRHAATATTPTRGSRMRVNSITPADDDEWLYIVDAQAAKDPNARHNAAFQSLSRGDLAPCEAYLLATVDGATTPEATPAIIPSTPTAPLATATAATSAAPAASSTFKSSTATLRRLVDELRAILSHEDTAILSTSANSNNCRIPHAHPQPHRAPHTHYGLLHEAQLRPAATPP